MVDVDGLKPRKPRGGLYGDVTGAWINVCSLERCCKGKYNAKTESFHSSESYERKRPTVTSASARFVITSRVNSVTSHVQVLHGRTRRLTPPNFTGTERWRQMASKWAWT